MKKTLFLSPKILLTAISFLLVYIATKSQDKCASEAQIQEINIAASQQWQKPEVRQRLQQMQNNNKTNAAHVLFRWPLRTTAAYDGIPNYYMIQNYVDLDTDVDPNPSDTILDQYIGDYNCGNRTYDGHNGIDINIWPFWWNIMSQQYVYVVAAAPGLVTGVTDTNGNDQNCSCTGSNNVITILHADGSRSIYFHIKDNSAQVAQNDYVEEGQIIANVGSSGCSSNPHLHFEVRDSNNVRLEPFDGPCNNTTSDSWFQVQKPYWEPQINRIMTHGSDPLLTGYNGNSNFCPVGESKNAKNQFNPGEEVYFGVALHDMQALESATFSVYYPDGSTWGFPDILTQGNFISPRRYYVFSKVLSIFAPPGTYTFIGSYNGKNYYHYFTVGCTASYTLNGITLSGHNGYIAGTSIQSNATLANGSNIMLQAGSSITFSPNFTAPAGTVLKARIKGCNYTE
jgi:murein DD-endopeptidase MepM/ murein hydrolase activator NlpD